MPRTLARQPILDHRRRLHGYELLFRGTATATGEQATASVLVDSVGDLGLGQLVEQGLAFVNVTRRFLLDVDPLPLPPERFVLELLEGETIDARLVARLEALSRQGFRLALDDFVHTPEHEPALALADYVKVDVLAGGLAHAARQRALVAHHDVVLLAEKVEDEAMFAGCRALGYELFQGYFFCRPELVDGARVPAASLHALSTLAEIAGAAGDLDTLIHIVSEDPGLSVKLLRLVNSAALTRRAAVTGVRQAAALLGARQLRQWTLLVVLSGLPASSDALLPTALVRAHAMVALAPASDAEAAFLAGLLSVVDAMMSVPMSRIVAELPLAPPVRDALVDRGGDLGRWLARIEAFERGHEDAAVGGAVSEAILANAARQPLVA